MKTIYKHIEFGKEDGQWEIINKRHGEYLGSIIWYDDWDQWCLNSFESIYSVSCLKDVIHFINQLKEK